MFVHIALRVESAHPAFRWVKTMKKKKNPINIKRISNLEVSDFIAADQVRLRRMKERNFILRRSNKAVEELIKNTWLMKNAQAKIDRAKPRMQLVREAYSSECVAGCDLQWINCALEVLKNNNIHAVVFGSVVKDLLMKWTCNFRDAMLVGCANRGMSFLLNPLHVCVV